MKKLISIFLAILMMFSFVTVAFATEAAPEAGTETTAPETENTPETVVPDLGEYDWLLDLPFWTVGPAFKFAKIALKLVNVFLKVAKIFGLVDKDMGDYIIDAIVDMIMDAQNGEQTEDVTEAPEAETTAPIVA
ncbi:MAG: hypothetical protein IJB74_02265 [Clostridia bacterium]|nr:hypothetical protein [Clostridia bacterium]